MGTGDGSVRYTMHAEQGTILALEDAITHT
jgi:hypothetical protein